MYFIQLLLWNHFVENEETKNFSLWCVSKSWEISAFLNFFWKKCKIWQWRKIKWSVIFMSFGEKSHLMRTLLLKFSAKTFHIYLLRKRTTLSVMRSYMYNQHKLYVLINMWHFVPSYSTAASFYLPNRFYCRYLNSSGRNAN